MINEMKKYIDDDGRNVIGLFQVDTSYDTDPKYIGQADIQTQMGVMPIDFEFPEGYTLKQCFAEFDNEADKKIEEIKQKHKEDNLIVTPNDIKGDNQVIQFPNG